MAAALIATWSCDTGDDGADGSLAISGQVEKDGKAVAGVTVTLVSTKSGKTRTTKTDGDGQYEFAGAFSGAYTLLASKDGLAFLPQLIALTIEGQDADDNDFEALSLPEVVLPDGMPFWDNPHIAIDKDVIAEVGARYLAEKGDAADALEFFGGYLPLETADLLCSTAPDKEQMNKYLGNMYISGFYGGVWLRDVLFSNDTSGAQRQNAMSQLMALMMNAMPGVMSALMSGGGAKGVFNGVVNAAGTPVVTALFGEPGEIFGANRGAVDILFMIYGYDYGYYNYLIENPPEGAPDIADPLKCNQFMDCRMIDLELQTLTGYKPVLESLFHPNCDAEGDRWCTMNQRMKVVGKGSVAQGDAVWNNIMANNTMMDPAYAPLIDLSARFMLVSELTLLPTMQGWAEQNVASGRCGLLQEAAMMAWLGSYVSGLSSNLKEGVFPSLE